MNIQDLLNTKRVRFESVIKSASKDIWRVELVHVADKPDLLYEAPKRLLLDSDQPALFEARSEDTFDNIVRSRLTLNIVADSVLNYIDLYSETSRDYFCVLYKNNKLFWVGGLEPEMFEMDVARPNQILRLMFSDFAGLDRLRFNYRGQFSVLQILNHILTAPFKPLDMEDEYWFNNIPKPRIVYSCSTSILKLNSLLAVNTFSDFSATDIPLVPDVPSTQDPISGEDSFDQNNDNIWQQTLQDEVSIAPRTKTLKSYYNNDRIKPNSLSANQFTCFSGPKCLSEVYINLENFYDDSGEALSYYDTLKEILKAFCLRVEQRNGTIYVYDIESCLKMTRRRLIPTSDSRTLSVSKIYEQAEIRVSQNEKSELDTVDKLKGFKNPDKTLLVPSMLFQKKYNAYQLNIKKPTGEDSIPFLCHDDSVMFSTKPLAKGQKELGVAVWLNPGVWGGDRIIKARNQTNLDLKPHHEKINRIVKKNLSQLSDNDFCYHIKRIRLPLLTTEITSEYFCALDFRSFLSTQYDFFSKWRDEFLTGDINIEKKRLKRLNKLEQTVVFVAFYVKIYATNKTGQRKLVLRNLRKEGENWIQQDPEWVDISQDSKSLFQVNSGSVDKPYQLQNWNKPNTEVFPIIEPIGAQLLFDTNSPYEEGAIFPLPDSESDVSFLEIGITNKIIPYTGEKKKGEFQDIGEANPDLNMTYPTALTHKKLNFHFLNSFLLKDLKVKMARKDGSEISDLDIIYVADINKNSREKFSDSLLFSSNSELASGSLSALYDSDGKRIARKLYRAGKGGTLEQLYMNTLFAAYHNRKMTYEGQFKFHPGLFTYRVPKASGEVETDYHKKDLICTELSINLRLGFADMKLYEIEKDIYQPLEEE